MTIYEQNHRRSGRTTRMLEAVAEQAICGKTVAVVYGHPSEKSNLTFVLQTVLSKHADGMASFDRVKFFHVTNHTVDLESPRIIQGRDWPVFVDHHAVEVKIGQKLIDMLHAWDEPRKDPP